MNPLHLSILFVAPLALSRTVDAFSSSMTLSLHSGAFATKSIRSSWSTTTTSSSSSQNTSLQSLSHAESAHGMPWKTTIGQSDHPDPLLYMPFWEWQMEYMKSSLTNLEPDLTALSDFGYQENTQKKARIVSQCYKSQEYRKIRMTYYDAGDNTQVFNSVWYPDPKYNLPILGIDLLAFNRKKYLAIVDFQPLYSNEEDHAQTFSHRLAPIKSQYNALKGQMSSKFYDETQFFSKQMLFARFEEEKVVHNDLFPAFKRYVMMHNRILKDTLPLQDPVQQERVLDRHRAYDTYSAERDPATGLFAAMFGKEWADEYVFDFLFSMSERREEEEGLVAAHAASSSNHNAMVGVGESPSSSHSSSQPTRVMVASGLSSSRQ